MPETPEILDENSTAVLVITLYGNGPISAAQLGKLFTSLSRDYKQIARGRMLVVSSIRAGSIVTILTDSATAAVNAAAVAAPHVKDAAEIVKGTWSIAKFADKVASALGRAREGGGGVFERGQKRAGQRSAEALYEAAINSGHEVEIKHTMPDGEVFKMRVTPSEAIVARERARAKIAQIEGGSPVFQQITAAQKHRLLLPSLRTKALADAFVQMDGRREIDALIAAVVDTLGEAGAEQALETIALTLESGGHYALAATIRGQRDDGPDRDVFA